MGGSTGEGEATGEILGQCSRTCCPQRENESEEVTANGAGKVTHTHKVGKPTEYSSFENKVVPPLLTKFPAFNGTERFINYKNHTLFPIPSQLHSIHVHILLYCHLPVMLLSFSKMPVGWKTVV